MHPQVRPDPALGLLKLYDEALPHVYGYLLARCGDAGLAEDLTAEAFLAAVHAVRKPGAPDPSIPWLIGVARHKLADHWRRVQREQRGLRLLDGEPTRVDDPWETVIDRIRAREVLDRLGAHHRAALTLRYLDGLPVPEVARHLDRTPHATEALLVRPAPRSAGSTRERRARDDGSVRGSARARHAGRSRPRVRRAAAEAADPGGLRTPRRNHVPADGRDPGRARARLASDADPLHRRARRPARHGLVRRGVRSAAPRRAPRQRGRYDRPRRGRHRRRGADVRRSLRPVARRASTRAGFPRDVQPLPPPGGR